MHMPKSLPDSSKSFPHLRYMSGQHVNDAGSRMLQPTWLPSRHCGCPLSSSQSSLSPQPGLQKPFMPSSMQERPSQHFLPFTQPTSSSFRQLSGSAMQIPYRYPTGLHLRPSQQMLPSSKQSLSNSFLHVSGNGVDSSEPFSGTLHTPPG